jgi:dinuclear metal center YbgI/SA1388 family protein
VHDRDRLKTLFDNDITLAGYHLALDAHPQVGNNAVICDRLGVADREPFGVHGTHTLGFVGALDRPLSIAQLVERVEQQIGPGPLVLGRGPETIERVAVISGGASEYVAAAAAAGAECFITGEPNEQTKWATDEAGIHCIAAGHYATEVFGVQALGALLVERFSVEHGFIDIPNPV